MEAYQVMGVKRKFPTFSSKSGRGGLREVVAYKRFQNLIIQLFEWETFFNFENWPLRKGGRLGEVVTTGIFYCNNFSLFSFAWSVFLHLFLIIIIINWFSRKYIGQIFTDCLVHDEKALKYLVDTIGEVRLQYCYCVR